jgi:hypothetical protein
LGKTCIESSTGWTLKRLATCVMQLSWNVCTHMPASGLVPANLHCVHEALIVLKAACTLIKLGSGLCTCSSPSSLAPHPCDQHTTHWCLPFTPAAPPTFLTWLRQGITAVTVLTSMGKFTAAVLVKNITCFHYFFSNDSAGRSATVHSKHMVLLLFFSQKWSFQEYFGSGPRILNNWCRNMALRGMIHPI